MNRQRLRRLLREDWAAALLFLAPSLAGFGMFYAVPFGIGIYESFTDGARSGAFAGLDNYGELLASSSFRKAAGNTLLFTGISVPLLIGVSLLLALLLNRQLPFRRALRTAFILPIVVPVASIVLIWQIFIDWNGTFNAWLNYFGRERIDFLQSEGSMIVIVALYVWKNVGYDMLLFLAGLQSIPKDYYETARIEGAGRVRLLFHVTFVYLTPTMFFVVLISIINSFKVFRETYLLAGDYPYDSIYMLQHFMNNMFFSLDIQKLTAAAALMLLGIVLLVSILLRTERRFREAME